MSTGTRASDGNDAKILDDDLAIKLGFGRRRAIRSLIKRMIDDGNLEDVETLTRTARWEIKPGVSVTRTVEHYLLTDEQVRKIRLRSNARVNRSDDLYIIESSCGWFQIGRSGDPPFRLGSLETAVPPSVSLEIIAVAPGCGVHERLIHDAFGKYRGRGEWFNPLAGPEIRSAIAEGIEVFAGRVAETLRPRPRSGFVFGRGPSARTDRSRLTRVLAMRMDAAKRSQRRVRQPAAIPVPADPAQSVLPFPGGEP